MATYSAQKQGSQVLAGAITVASCSGLLTYNIPWNKVTGLIDYSSLKGRKLTAAEYIALDKLTVDDKLIRLFKAIAAANPEYDLGMTDHGGHRRRATVQGQDVDLNKAVHGANGSQHKYGRAGDIWLRHRTTGKYMPAHIFAVKAERLMLELGIKGGVGVYPGYDWYIHVDTRGSWAAWYRTYNGAKCPAQGGRYCAFRKGHEAAGVRLMQEWLIAHGYTECGGPDGVFGEKTEAALKRFQADRKRKVDGVFGRTSNKDMDNLLPW